MTQVPHITITYPHIASAIAALGESLSYVEICNKAISIALAEQNQEQYITADEARALGAGNAEYLDEDNEWRLCSSSCKYRDCHKYRAIRKEVPAEQCGLTSKEAWLAGARAGLGLTVNTPRIDVAKQIPKPKPAAPHAELKALYAQQVKDGTLEDFVWEVDRKDNGESYRKLDTPQELPAWSVGYKYRCTPKPTCQICNLDPAIREGVIALLQELGLAK